ncbi:2Fe-2S iron-sulfur cluster-binding protein [Actinopolymorpha sp. B17G11]|uniref:2Fe-2S iron-sulfur cluster-binding protein n=1 Tax=unclassified Actinopolymorpha TaxID=2627063 RepID=UPI0032D8EB30
MLTGGGLRGANIYRTTHGWLIESESNIPAISPYYRFLYAASTPTSTGKAFGKVGALMMPKITYCQQDGSAMSFDVRTGMSVMEAALEGGVDGIVAECGGNLICATCHVYVNPEQLDRLPEMRIDEDAMLDNTASPREANSRLSCQLRVTGEFDGLIVTVPEEQT